MNSPLALAPLLTIVLGALVLMLLEVFIKKDNKEYLGFFGLVFLAGCGALCFLSWESGYSYFGGGLLLDKLSLFLCCIFVVAVALVILLSLKYLHLQDANSGEFYALLLFALCGMMIMVSSLDLLVIFLGLEVLSVSSYALAGLKKTDTKSSEAAVKYFLLGSFASAFLVFGIALLFGSLHSLTIPEIILNLKGETGLSGMALAGLGLIIVGFGFKIAIVPFHMWTPDVYEGAPTPITAFFSVGPKAVGLAVLLRIFQAYWEAGYKSDSIFWTLWILAVLTMVVGNLTALRQTNIKRMLAYSSIAHAGYLLVAILAKDGVSLVFYLTVYLFMNLGAFGSVIALGKKGTEYVEIEDYAGLGYKYPWIGAALSVFLFSLAGFPPTGGFLAKLFVFSSAVRQEQILLVVIAVLASLISVYYYIRVIVFMYMKPAERNVDIFADNPALYLALFLCLYGVLQLGIFPGNILVFIKQAAGSLPLF